MSTQQVLVVEDDPLVSAVLAAVLADRGMQAHMVQSGEEALFALEDNVFDIIISDLQMPGVSGLEVLCRARERLAGVHLVLISGRADEDARSAVQELGGVLLQKPFGASDLRSVLEPG